MIPNTKNRVLESGGVEASAEFGISLNDAAHIMTILRDTLYSDKVLAVLREYSANAWDSHRESGKPDVPIKVTLPTEMEPTLSIRDFGNGLSPHDVFQVFTQYGASTKRGSDSSVGMLGIGSKSGFAYSDSFTIVSFYGGAKRTYVAVLDKSEKGIIQLLHEEPCGDETGVLIQIAVRQEDINEFIRKAETLFTYFHPRPETNINIPPLPSSQKKLKAGVIYDASTSSDDGDKWVAVMGCVSYRINLDQISTDEYRIPPFIRDISGAIYFDIGEVQINASREELKYSNETKKILVSRFDLLIEEYISQTLSEIQGSNFTLWEKRVRAQVLRNLGLPLPKGTSDDLVSGFVTLPRRKDKDELDEEVEKEKEAPKSFLIYRGKQAALTIQILERTRLVIRDDFRALAGYKLGDYDYVVRKAPGKVSWDQARADLDLLITELGLSGITTVKMSEMQWTPPSRGWVASKGPGNVKHRVRTFRLKNDLQRHDAYSGYWIVESREPQDTDVFVLIEKFKACGVDLFKTHQEDMQLSRKFNLQLPDIYGYKSTDKKPVIEEDCKGTHYSKWRENWLKTLLTDEVKEEMETWYWAGILADRYNNRYGNDDRYAVVRTAKYLGLGHPLTNFLKKVVDARKSIGDADESIIKVLINEFPIEKTKAQAEYDVLMDKYQLLGISNFMFRNLWGDDAEKWAHYVLMVDEVTGKEEDHGKLAIVHAD